VLVISLACSSRKRQNQHQWSVRSVSGHTKGQQKGDESQQTASKSTSERSRAPLHKKEQHFDESSAHKKMVQQHGWPNKPSPPKQPPSKTTSLTQPEQSPTTSHLHQTASNCIKPQPQPLLNYIDAKDEAARLNASNPPDGPPTPPPSPCCCPPLLTPPLPPPAAATSAPLATGTMAVCWGAADCTNAT